MDTIYPDTEAGVLDCLKEMTISDLTNAKCTPDPVVQGIWKVYCPNIEPEDERTLIVYLAGYPNPFGIKRNTNDFEICD
jgi:hypothetical protein